MATQQKIAIITGASSGIGKASAIALMKEGWSVALAGRRGELLEQAINEAGAAGASSIAVPTNVADEASVRALFEKTKSHYGRLDLLFNNAGVSSPAVPLEDFSFDKWKAIVDVNLSAVFQCTQEAFRIMKAQEPRGGRIINNGSISAHTPRPNSSPYTATKHGVTGLTKCASLDGRKYDIAVGQIDVGNAATELAAKMAKGVQQANGSVAPEPMMDVEDVAKAVVYMAGLPLGANVQFMTVMATKMPFVGRG
ncbi:MAG: SDR family oxidoreductase [Burkholderiales bacterium]